MNRANYIGAPEMFNLNNVAAVLNEAFGYHNYLVGSSIERRDFRDVDIRCILSDEEFDRLFQPYLPQTISGQTLINYATNARWSLVCSAISEWLSSRTGLKIDFQIQRQTEANTEDGPRQALGIFIQPRCQHQWTGQQAGGNPADASSYEWVEYCALCGVERGEP